MQSSFVGPALQLITEMTFYNSYRYALLSIVYCTGFTVKSFTRLDNIKV
jgi:hypothetical protein